MTRNDRLGQLQPYSFAKLRALLADAEPADANAADLTHIPLSLGEPKHAAPDFILDYLSNREQLASNVGLYPATAGSQALRESIAAWLGTRFTATVDPDTQCLPVNGTREALFSFAQAMLSGKPGCKVIAPNPFYQIYEGAALLAGAQPIYLNNDPAHNYAQDYSSISVDVWRDTELMYICSPGNPTGHTLTEDKLAELIELAQEHDFIIAADECYSEIYLDEDKPPPGLLGVCAKMGVTDYRRCMVFHSLSKRSNLPGLRSGFVAGDAQLIKPYTLYRTYHGCAMGAHQQAASTLAWCDETHVEANRSLYRDKFSAVEQILAPHYDLEKPGGGFYHWLRTPIADTDFALGLKRSMNVTALPGQFLARETPFGNPGANHVRIAWVAELENCIEAAQRLAEFAVRLG